MASDELQFVESLAGGFPQNDKLKVARPEIPLSFAQLFSKSPMKIENTLRNPKELRGSGGN